MEKHLEKAIVFYKRNRRFQNYVTFASEDGKKKYQKRFEKLICTPNGILHATKGKVPRSHEVESVIAAIQFKDRPHVQDVDALVIALSKGGYAMTKFLGGLRRIVEE